MIILKSILLDQLPQLFIQAEEEIEVDHRKNIWKITKRVLITALLFIMPVLFTGCSDPEEPTVHINMPYEPDTPAPAPHEGVFTSEHGTMTFSGDGESVIIDFDKKMSDCLRLPEGKQEARYVFLSGEYAPYGRMPIRYDVASMFRIITGEGKEIISAEINIGEYKDGRFQTGTDHTTADRITFFMDWENNGDWEAVDFLK